MKRRAMLFVVASVVVLATNLQADDKANPTGTWKWKIMFNDQSRDVTLKLKLEGDKLTGAMLGRNNEETPITDATFKDGELSFTVTRERDGRKMVTKYAGKVMGDTIKGKMKFERQGQTMERDWEAQRAKEST